jgi:folate receptor
MKASSTVACASALLVSFVFASEGGACKPFKEIYADGTALCERLFEDSFKVVEDSEPSYTMWFFDTDVNPNDAVATTLHGEGHAATDQCNLQYFHKETPGPEDDDMSECHPWKNNACCDSTTVPSSKAIKENYGLGYEWDRCGPMSEACERFFVQEACLYECDANAGLYRKYLDPSDPDYNEWQMFEMPIKKSYCDAWYDACRNDYFCGNGSFFECQNLYWEDLKEEEENAEESKERKMTIGLSIAGAAAFIGLVFSLFLIRKERSGAPMFAPIAGQAEGVST